MKKLLPLLLTVIILLSACSEKPPSVRATNLSSSKANIQVKVANSNTININDLAPNITSRFQDIVPGGCFVTVNLQDFQEPYSHIFTALNDKNYTIVIESGKIVNIKVNVTDK